MPPVPNSTGIGIGLGIGVQRPQAFNLGPFHGLIFSTSGLTYTDRNAIPNNQRTNGMIVYEFATQTYFQLLPEPITGWTGTDSDWIIFSALNPYTPPKFVAFFLSGIGNIQAAGATISGSVTFKWTTNPSANVAANTISIVDTTTSTTLATNLANTGSHTLTLPSPVTGAANDTHTWTISGLDTNSNPFSTTLVISWVTTSDQTYYVRTDGNDSNNGKSDNSGGAWLTLQHAADSVLVGDKVIIRAGTYAGFNLGWNGSQNGADGHPIWFAADSSVIINNRNDETPDGIDVENCSNVWLTGFEINNTGQIPRAGIRMSSGGTSNKIDSNTVINAGEFGIITGFLKSSFITNNTVSGTLPNGQGTGHGIYSANGGDNITIQNNTCYSNNGDGIHTNGDITEGGTGVQTGLLITQNTLYDNNKQYGGAGINCDGILNSTISNNLIYNTHSAGIALYQVDASAPSTGNIVVCNTILLAIDSAKHCLRLANGSVGNIVFNNIFYAAASTGCAIAADPDSLPVSDYNMNIDPNGVGRFSVDTGSDAITLVQWQGDTGQDDHSLIAMALTDVFTNPPPGGNDYSLAPSGPAINTGIGTFDSVSAPSVDILGNPRPFDALWDIGAYESQVATIVISGKTPANSSSGVALNATVSWTYDRAIDPTTVVFALSDGGGSIAGTLSYNSGTRTSTFTPTSNFTMGDTITATLTSVTALDSVTLVSPVVWTFQTTGSHRLFGASYTPPTPDSNDGTNITVGLNWFTNGSSGGTITKAWFWMNANNTGTHTAKVWDSVSATLLGSATFSGEVAGQWNSVVFSPSIAITQNQRITLGIHMPNGHYADDTSIHTKSNSPLFTADVLSGSFHPSCFIAGDANPNTGSQSDNFYGIDIEAEE